MLVFTNSGLAKTAINGMMDATKSYESTVENFSVINQTFGTTIDYMKMMNFQSTADKVDYMRKKFMETGRDMSQLTRAEYDLLKAHTNLDDATLMSVFSDKNKEVSSKDMRTESQKATDAMLSQVDAMKALATEMKQLVKQGQQIEGGVFNHLLEGFLRGIQGSKEFIGMMMNIRRVLHMATLEGVELGRKFVQFFPGVSKVFEGIRDLFDPERFRKLFKGLSAAFDIFQEDGENKFDKFMKKLNEVFFDFFKSGKPASDKVISGFQDFFGALSKIFSQLAIMAINKLSEIIPKITEWLKNPEVPQISATDGWGKVLAPLMDVFDEFKKKLWPKLVELASTLWQKFKDALFESDVGQSIISGAVAVVLGPAIMRSVTAAISGGMFSGIGKAIFGGIGADIKNEKQGAAAVSNQISEALPAKGPGMGTSESISEGIKSVAESAKPAEQLNEVAGKKEFNWKKIGEFVVGFAGLLTVGLGAFFIAAGIVAATGISLETIGKTGLIFGAVSTTMVPAAALLVALSHIDKYDSESANKAMKDMAKVMGGGFLLFLGAAALVALSGVSIITITTTGLIFTAVAGMLGAAGLLLTEAALIGKLTSKLGVSAMAGIENMMAVSLALVGFATVLGLLTSAVPPAELGKLKFGVEIIKSLAETFGTVGLVLGEAALIGSLTIASGGALQAILIAGLATIGGAVAQIVVEAKSLMQDLSKMQVDPGSFKVKAEAFSKILDVMVKMMQVFPDLLKGMNFRFWESEESQIKKMQSVTSLVKTLLNGDDNQGGITKLVTIVLESLQKVTPAQAQAAGSIASVLNAVASMMSAAAGPATAIVKESSSFLGLDVDVTERVMDKAKQLISHIMGDVQEFVKKMAEVITGIQGTDNFAKSASSFGGLLGAVGNMISTIQPDISKFKSETKFGEGQGGRIDVDKVGMTNFFNNMKSLLEAMTTHLPPLFNALMSTVSSNLTSLSEKQLAAIPSIAQLFSAVGSIMGAIAKMPSSMTKETKESIGEKATAAGQEKITKITREAPSLAKTLNEFAGSLPELLGSVIKLAATPGLDTEKIKSLVTVFESVGKITSAITSIDSGSTSEDLKSGEAYKRFGNRMKFAKGVLELLKTGSAVIEAEGKSVSVESVSAKDISEMLMSVPDIKANTANKFGNLTDFFTKLSTLSESTSKFPSSLASINSAMDVLKNKENFKKVDETSKQAIKDNITSLGEMYRYAQNVNDQLAQLPKLSNLNVPAKLTAFANGLGLGGQYNYSIRSADVVVNLELHVSMDTVELEGVMLARRKSIIRDRINLALSNRPADRKVGGTLGLNRNEYQPVAADVNG